jgi:hypothetical protein
VQPAQQRAKDRSVWTERGPESILWQILNAAIRRVKLQAIPVQWDTQSSPTGTHPAFRLSIEYRVRTSFPYALLHASPCSLEVCQGRRTIHLITFAPVHVCAGYEAPSQKATWCSTHIVFIPYSRSRHRTDPSPPQPSSPSTGCHLSLQRLRLSNLKTRRDPFRR